MFYQACSHVIKPRVNRIVSSIVDRFKTIQTGSERFSYYLVPLIINKSLLLSIFLKVVSESLQYVFSGENLSEKELIPIRSKQSSYNCSANIGSK